MLVYFGHVLCIGRNIFVEGLFSIVSLLRQMGKVALGIVMY